MSKQNQNPPPGTVILGGRPYAPVEPSRPARKVVQVLKGFYEIVALCDDGTMWDLKWRGLRPAKLVWARLPNIPQDDNKEQP